MKSNELRQGNLLLDKETGTIVEFICLDIEHPCHRIWVKVDINGKKEERGWPIVDVAPIQITEKWLTKHLGFKDLEKVKVFSNGKIDLERLTLRSKEWELCIFEQQTDVTVQYVHTLQNIFLDLNVPLTITL